MGIDFRRDLLKGGDSMHTKWWKSKIFWGSIVVVVTSIGALMTGEATLGEALTAAVGALIAIFRLFFTDTNLTT